MSAAIEHFDAVVFDLDDTLYLQSEYLAQVWYAVAVEAAGYGVDAARFEHALSSVSSEGSDKGGIIDRALATVGGDLQLVPHLVETFRSFRPRRLTLVPAVGGLLAALARQRPIGLVTDGDPDIQRAKLQALNIGHLFTAAVFSDEAGRQFRKPSAVPFRRALLALNASAARSVFVGDRPGKDIGGAAAVGMQTIRVLTGEYGAAPDVVAADVVVSDAAEALRLLLAACTEDAPSSSCQ